MFNSFSTVMMLLGFNSFYSTCGYSILDKRFYTGQVWLKCLLKQRATAAPRSYTFTSAPTTFYSSWLTWNKRRSTSLETELLIYLEVICLIIGVEEIRYYFHLLYFFYKLPGRTSAVWTRLKGPTSQEVTLKRWPKSGSNGRTENAYITWARS